MFFAVGQATKIKHSTPDKQSQRNSNADDDIFFDMDGLDTRDSNMTQMTQSDDEDVDDDEDIGATQNMIFATILIQLIHINFDLDSFLVFFFLFLDDSYVSRSNEIKITPNVRRSSSRMFVAQSLPMAVPMFNQRNEDDYEEVCSLFYEAINFG